MSDASSRSYIFADYKTLVMSVESWDGEVLEVQEDGLYPLETIYFPSL